MLEKGQYGRIRRLRLIVYHHNLNVVYGGMYRWYRGIIDSFSGWHKQNI
jgi:hypothetical protein